MPGPERDIEQTRPIVAIPEWTEQDRQKIHEELVDFVGDILDSPRTRCFEFGEPVETGMTHAITFAGYGASRHVDEDGITYRIRTISGVHEDGTDEVWVLDPNPDTPSDQQGRVGREDPSADLSRKLAGLTPMDRVDYKRLRHNIPETYADALAMKHIAYPPQPLIRRLGYLIFGRG